MRFDIARREVSLLDVPHLAWREPFFHETISRARREHHDAAEVRVDFERFVASADCDGASPAGFIYHVGRCGSTLLANMLAASNDHVLFKEADPISELMAHRLGNDDAAREIGALLAATIRYLLRAANASPYRSVKFAAWNIRCASMLSRSFPDTPTLFIFRAPSETVASLLCSGPSWADLVRCPRALQARFFPSISEVPEDAPLGPLVLFAHAWRSTAEAALAMPPETTLFVDYSELVRDPAAALRRVLAHLRQPLDRTRLADMIRAGAIYSKDSSGRVAFDPGGAHRRPPLSALQRAVVEDITGDVWHRLAERRSRSDLP